MIQRYKIDGTLQMYNELHPEPNCLTCKNGEIFDKPNFWFDLYGPSHAEPICAVCNSKYKVPRIDCRKMTKEGYELFKNYTEQNWEVEKMNPEILELRQIYRQEHECPKHELKPAQPFTTALGTFVVRSCPVCMIGQVDYKGKTYQAPTMELLNWIAHESIEHTKVQESLKVKMIDLGIGIEQNKPVLAEPMLDLFKHTEIQAPIPQLPNLFE